MPLSKYCLNKKPLSKGHKGVRLLTYKGTPRAQLNMWGLSTISKHSPVLHQELVRFAPQVHFNSSYSGSLVQKGYAYQGGCGESETTNQPTNQKSPRNHPIQLKTAQ